MRAINWAINLVLNLNSCWLKLLFGLWNLKKYSLLRWLWAGSEETRLPSSPWSFPLVTRHHFHTFAPSSGFWFSSQKKSIFFNLELITTFRNGPHLWCHHDHGAHVMTVTKAALHLFYCLLLWPKLSWQISEELWASLSKTAWLVMSAKAENFIKVKFLICFSNLVCPTMEGPQ